ncbi:MAG: hypothetical protein QXP07_00085 [Candidatus Parvarchaeum sp.]|nr:hypothetical protein [Candidatus Parvarchaeum tengchongense]
MSENDLYPAIEEWLNRYLREKYPKYQVETTYKSSTHTLENMLREYGIRLSRAYLLNIKIDIIGILKDKNREELVFVEVKDALLTLKDLGQLWGYTQLINPIESFLISSKGLGILAEIYTTLNRRDLFVYGTKHEKTMKAAVWSAASRSIDYSTLIPHS